MLHHLDIALYLITRLNRVLDYNARPWGAEHVPGESPGLRITIRITSDLRLHTHHSRPSCIV
jgi:hypothetical protein